MQGRTARKLREEAKKKKSSKGKAVRRVEEAGGLEVEKKTHQKKTKPVGKNVVRLRQKRRSQKVTYLRKQLGEE